MTPRPLTRLAVWLASVVASWTAVVVLVWLAVRHLLVTLVGSVGWLTAMGAGWCLLRTARRYDDQQRRAS